MKIIDIESWNRKEHFEFFSKFDNPFFGIVTEVDCTKAYDKAKRNNHSFFAYYLHKSISAVNKVEELKLRIIGEKVVLPDVIHAGTTIAREDGTFAFALIPFSEDFETFNLELQKEIICVKNSAGLRLEGEAGRVDLIQYSTVPWFSFTGLSHPRKFNRTESIPKITFGKISDKMDNLKQEKKMLPVSIDANHALADGIHIGRYLNEFQNLLDE